MCLSPDIIVCREVFVAPPDHRYFSRSTPLGLQKESAEGEKGQSTSRDEAGGTGRDRRLAAAARAAAGTAATQRRAVAANASTDTPLVWLRAADAVAFGGARLGAGRRD